MHNNTFTIAREAAAVSCTAPSVGAIASPDPPNKCFRRAPECFRRAPETLFGRFGGTVAPPREA
eukprot:15458910-Alexandrium_andersonii.AAC.1